MALTNEGWQPFSVEKAMIFPYSAGVPGAGQNLPVVGVDGSPNTDEIEHRGNNAVISKTKSFNSYDLTVTVPEWDLAALAVMCGGTVSSITGSTPDQKQSLTHKTTDNPPPFGLITKSPSKSTAGGQTRLKFPNCQQASLPSYALADNEYNDLEVETSAIKNGSDEIVIVERWENGATAISSTWA